MRNISRWAMAGTALLVLSGCTPQYKMTTDFVPPLSLSGKQCVAQCKQARDYCEHRSNDAATGCQSAAHDRALIDFHAYQNQYGNSSKQTTKTVEDFYDDSQCQQITQCTPVYQQCFVHCGGTAEKKKVCVKNCKDDGTQS